LTTTTGPPWLHGATSSILFLSCLLSSSILSFTSIPSPHHPLFMSTMSTVSTLGSSPILQHSPQLVYNLRYVRYLPIWTPHYLSTAHFFSRLMPPPSIDSYPPQPLVNIHPPLRQHSAANASRTSVPLAPSPSLSAKQQTECSLRDTKRRRGTRLSNGTKA